MHFQSMCFSTSECRLAHDDELVQPGVARLQSRLDSQVRDFQMSTREGGLILRGEVKPAYGKQMAQEVVMEVSGLSILANDIEVQCGAVTQRGTVAAN